jgi:hypothetical protein
LKRKNNITMSLFGGLRSIATNTPIDAIRI